MKQFLLILLLSVVSFAQNLTTVQASNIQSSAGVPLAAGTILFYPVDSHGQTIGYQIGGGGQVFNAPVTCPILNGAITSVCHVANVSLTNPRNICFSAVVKDALNQIILGTPVSSGYECVQPQTINQWCNAGVCNFDAFTPSVPGIPASILYPPTASTLGGVFALQCPDALGQKFIGYDLNGKPVCASDQIGNGVFDLELESPSTVDSGKFKYLGYPADITITKISCNTDTGIASINLEIKTSTDWLAPGTPILSSPVQCGTTPTDVTSISVPNVAADTPIALDIPAVSSSPTLISVRVYFQLQTQ